MFNNDQYGFNVIPWSCIFETVSVRGNLKLEDDSSDNKSRYLATQFSLRNSNGYMHVQESKSGEIGHAKELTDKKVLAAGEGVVLSQGVRREQ